MLIPEFIRRKRDGHRLDPDAITAFIQGVVQGSVADSQIAAFCMAVFFRGLDPDERTNLTRAMARSGVMLDWHEHGLGRAHGRPLLDKHSTGGVGDKVSLLLAPIVAACGGHVPMISGRGLGHTGGTVDKLESIPGYRTGPDRATFVRTVREVGCAIIGQTMDLAPADGRIYAVRDVTATVESLDLITASILSKKLAAGLDVLVLDVKVGSGAFMGTHEAALALAESLVAVSNGAGLPTRALLTDMDGCLGRTAGNALEVCETIDILTGAATGDPHLRAVTLELAAEMLSLGGLAGSADEGLQRATAAIDSGRAADQFARMVKALGGPGDLIRLPRRYLPSAPVIKPVHADRTGIVASIDGRALGMAVVQLGGGRTRPDDDVDPAVGFSEVAALGETVGPSGRPLAIVHARDEDAAARAASAVRRAMTVADEAPVMLPSVRQRIG